MFGWVLPPLPCAPDDDDDDDDENGHTQNHHHHIPLVLRMLAFRLRQRFAYGVVAPVSRPAEGQNSHEGFGARTRSTKRRSGAFSKHACCSFCVLLLIYNAKTTMWPKMEMAVLVFGALALVPTPTNASRFDQQSKKTNKYEYRLIIRKRFRRRNFY
eukprot:scaffold34609_cov146-Amphora_coffeaeformis.AAC.13